MSLFKPPFGATVDWAHPLSKGLAGYWLLNEGGGNYANDIAFKAKGTLTGMDNSPATTTSGWGLGDSLRFDGTNDYVNCGNTVPFDSSNFTISIWLKPVAFGSYVRMISYYGDGPTLWYNAGNMQVVHSGAIDFNCSISLSTTNWNHVLVSRVGSTITSYLNGIQKAQNTSFTKTYTANTSVYLGNSTAYNEPYNGLMKNVRIYTRGINSNEARELYVNPYAGTTQKQSISKKIANLISSTSNFFFGA